MTPTQPTILVVDDEPSNRKLLAGLIAREGYRVIVAEGGREALAIIEREKVDLVLLDIMMPDVDGMAVLAELQKQKRLPRLPVVVVTAHEDRETRVDALAAGAIDFVTKPVDRLAVACRVRTLIELGRMREAELSRIESALEESEHRLRLRFEQSPVAKIEWDPNYRVVAWNRAAERLFGYSRQEALGRHARFLLPEQEQSRSRNGWEEMLAEAAHKTCRTNVALDGATLYCEWHNAALRSADGTFIGFSSAVIDCTERTLLERQMRAAQRMEAVGRLAGGIAHDFNNVLSVIETYTSFMLRTLPVGDPLGDDVAVVRDAARRAAGLTRQLLAFTRRQVAHPEAANVNRLIDELGKMLRRVVGEDVTFDCRLADGLWLVDIDPSHLEQILLNLAINSRDAMPDGGTITIETRNFLVDGREARRVYPEVTPGRYVELVVNDTGLGMDEHTRQRVFEPFFTTKVPGKGTGLGLSTVYGIVKQAGGYIGVESAPGEGATFRICFPCSAAKRESTRPAPPMPASLKGTETILVVEDDPDLRRAVVRMLKQADYVTLEAKDGGQATQICNNYAGRIDALLSDIVIPDVNGHELAQQLAESRAYIKPLFMSGYSETTVSGTYALGGAANIVQKPFTEETLLTNLRAVLDVTKGRRQGSM